MKRVSRTFACLLFCLLLLQIHLAAEDSIPKTPLKRFIIKGYPLAVFSGQLPLYIWQFKTSLQYRINAQNSIEFGLGVIIPDYLSLGITRQDSWGIWPALDFRGGRGLFSYRHYFKPQGQVVKHRFHARDIIETDEPAQPVGLYIGGEISVTGLQSSVTTDYLTDGNRDGPNYFYNVWESPPYRAHAILSTNSFIIGRVYRTRKNGVIDISGSAGFQYIYLWRHYAIGNLEFDHSALYGFLKEFPVVIAFNLGFGGMF